MRAFSIAPILPLLLACNAVHLPAVSAYDFHLDASVTSDANGVKGFNEAVKQWTTFTGIAITSDEAPKACMATPGCFNVYEVPQAELDTESGGSNFIGLTVPGAISVAAGLDYDALQDTMIHEMGHALGLMHPCAAPCSVQAVMNPTYGAGEDHVACLDVAQFFSVRGLVVPTTVAPCTSAPGPLLLKRVLRAYDR
jgi:hypothetical protein